ncbi:MAG: peptidyl-prolyl cis-trans isomerase [Pseudomonadota bacterium]
MLRAMRDGAKQGWMKYILLGFLVLAGGGLVLTDVGGFFRGGVSAHDVAEVGDFKISAQDFDRNARRYFAQENMDIQSAYRYGFLDNILQNEINARLLSLSSADLGIRISDEQLTQELLDMTESMAQTEESRKLALQRILRQQGVSETNFLASLRQETANRIVRDNLMSGSNIIPESLTSVLYQYEHETRDVDVLILKNDRISDVEPPSDDSLDLYYEANKMAFLIPENRTITLAVLNEEMVKDRIEITDEELELDYQANVETFTVPERRVIEQTIGSSPEKAQEIFNLAKDGTNLKGATANVKGSDTSYQDPDEFEKSGLLEDIADPVFAAQKSDVIGPIETPLGWHVIRVTDIIEPDTIPFDQVKEDLRNDLMAERITDVMLDTANDIDDRLAGGEEFKSVVDEIGLTTQTIGPFKQSGVAVDKDEDLFGSYMSDRDEILETAFGFDIGESAPILELRDGRFLVIHVDDVQEQRYRSFDDVKDELVQKWMNEQKSLTNRADAQDTLAKIKGGISFGDAAKELGIGKKSFSNIKRRDPGEAKLPLQALDQLFSLPEGETLLSPYNDGYILVNLKNINLPDPEKAENADISKIQTDLFRVLPAEVVNQYLGSLQASSKVKINRRLLDQMYGTEDTGS